MLNHQGYCIPNSKRKEAKSAFYLENSDSWTFIDPKNFRDWEFTPSDIKVIRHCHVFVRAPISPKPEKCSLEVSVWSKNCFQDPMEIHPSSEHSQIPTPDNASDEVSLKMSSYFVDLPYIRVILSQFYWHICGPALIALSWLTNRCGCSRLQG